MAKKKPKKRKATKKAKANHKKPARKAKAKPKPRAGTRPKKRISKRKDKKVSAWTWLSGQKKPRAAKAAKVKKPEPRKIIKKANMPDICCKDIDISKWRLKKLVWKRKPFYVVKYGSFFHIPIGIGKAMVKGMETVSKKYSTPYPELWLSKETGLFSAKMMFAVDNASTSDPDIEELTGTFVTRGFQGPYKSMGNFIRVFIEQVRQKYGKKPSELYFWYANCPKCAKKQGGPKIVIFGRI